MTLQRTTAEKSSKPMLAIRRFDFCLTKPATDLPSSNGRKVWKVLGENTYGLPSRMTALLPISEASCCRFLKTISLLALSIVNPIWLIRAVESLEMPFSGRMI